MSKSFAKPTTKYLHPVIKSNTFKVPLKDAQKIQTGGENCTMYLVKPDAPANLNLDWAYMSFCFFHDLI